jgi:hypothetical protein
MREIKVNFARFYNRRHGRRGCFWGDRFKSVVVEDGNTLICLAYIDLNPVRAGLVERLEDYRWSSIGYHVQAGNKDPAFLYISAQGGNVKNFCRAEARAAEPGLPGRRDTGGCTAAKGLHGRPGDCNNSYFLPFNPPSFLIDPPCQRLTFRSNGSETKPLPTAWRCIMIGTMITLLTLAYFVNRCLPGARAACRI